MAYTDQHTLHNTPLYSCPPSTSPCRYQTTLHSSIQHAFDSRWYELFAGISSKGFLASWFFWGWNIHGAGASQRRRAPHCAVCCVFARKWRLTTSTGEWISLLDEVWLLCYQHRRVGYGYVRCQIGLDQATTRSLPRTQMVRDRASHCAAVCQDSYHLHCWMKPHIYHLIFTKGRLWEFWLFMQAILNDCIRSMSS